MWNKLCWMKNGGVWNKWWLRCGMAENWFRCMIRLYDPKMCCFLVILFLFNEMQMSISRKQSVLWEWSTNITDFFFHKIPIYSGNLVPRAFPLKNFKGKALGTRLIQWNLDMMKAQGTSKICLPKRGFVLSRFILIYFTATPWGNEIHS